jgi:hypothetical protein
MSSQDRSIVSHAIEAAYNYLGYCPWSPVKKTSPQNAQSSLERTSVHAKIVFSDYADI